MRAPQYGVNIATKMIAIVLYGLIAAASAAPQYFPQYGHSPFHHEHHHARLANPPFGGDIFDTSRFWSELSTELRQLDNMLADFSKRFPTSVSSEGVDGKEYKITIPLSGFEEKDIVVKARDGLLMVQAVHKVAENVERNYLDVRTLPKCVDVKGTWTYEQEVLKIVFPVKDDDAKPDGVTEVPVTEGPTDSREEIESNGDEKTQDQNADVGLERGDTDKGIELLTNEIPRNTVEATTYAVDLRDEVEFVPVRY